MKHLKWTKELTNNFWSELAGTFYNEQSSFSNAASLYLIELIQPYLKQDGACLDYGAGDGHLVGTLLRLGYPTSAFEPSDRKYTIKSKFDSHPLFLGMLDTTNVRKYKTVFLIETIEHLFEEDIPSILSEIYDLLDDDGTLIITTPNDEDLLKSSKYCPTCKHLFHPWQHIHSFTASSLSHLLSKFDFYTLHVHKTEYTESPLHKYKQEQLGNLGKNLLDELFLNGDYRTLKFDKLQDILSEYQTRYTNNNNVEEQLSSSNLSIGRATSLLWIGRKSASSAKQQSGQCLSIATDSESKDLNSNSILSLTTAFTDKFTKLEGGIAESKNQLLLNLLELSSTSKSNLKYINQSNLVLLDQSRDIIIIYNEFLLLHAQITNSLNRVVAHKAQILEPAYKLILDILSNHLTNTSHIEQINAILLQLVHSNKSTLESQCVFDKIVDLCGLYNNIHNSIITLTETLLNTVYKLLMFGSSEGHSTTLHIKYYLEKKAKQSLLSTDNYLGDIDYLTSTIDMLVDNKFKDSPQFKFIKAVTVGCEVDAGAIQRISLPRPYIFDKENCWYCYVPAFCSIADNNLSHNRSALIMFENESLMLKPHSSHDSIASLGQGRYSHWEDCLYFSSTDNSNPNDNNRTYSAYIPRLRPNILNSFITKLFPR